MQVSSNAFLLELFLEYRGAKACKKRSFLKKMHNDINPVCIKQNHLRKALKQALPSEIKEIEDSTYGVDYEYQGTKIDQKFSFGALGNNTIKIRVKNRRLLNKSDWTMAINNEREIEFFETKKLADFVKKNWGIVQKRLVEKKETHLEYAIRLGELYALERITPIKAGLTEENLFEGLEKITQLNNNQPRPENTPLPGNIENENTPDIIRPPESCVMPKTK